MSVDQSELANQYVLEVVDAMTLADQRRWDELLMLVGGEVFLETRLSRPVAMQKSKPPYAYVLGRESA